MIGVEVAIIQAELPLVRPQIARLSFTLSPQTGGCESDRDSALREGDSRQEEQPERDGDDYGTLHGSSWGKIACNPCWIFSALIGPGFTCQ